MVMRIIGVGEKDWTHNRPQIIMRHVVRRGRPRWAVESCRFGVALLRARTRVGFFGSNNLIDPRREDAESLTNAIKFGIDGLARAHQGVLEIVRDSHA